MDNPVERLINELPTSRVQKTLYGLALREPGRFLDYIVFELRNDVMYFIADFFVEDEVLQKKLNIYPEMQYMWKQVAGSSFDWIASFFLSIHYNMVKSGNLPDDLAAAANVLRQEITIVQELKKEIETWLKRKD